LIRFWQNQNLASPKAFDLVRLMDIAILNSTSWCQRKQETEESKTKSILT